MNPPMLAVENVENCFLRTIFLEHTSSTDFQSRRPERAVHFEFYVWSHINCVKQTSLTVFHNTSPDAVTFQTGWSVKQRLFLFGHKFSHKGPC